MKFVIALVAGGLAYAVARMLLVGLDGLAAPAALIAAAIVATLALALILKPRPRPAANEARGGVLAGGVLLAAGAVALADAGDSLMASLADEAGGLAADAGSFAGSALADLFSDD